MILATSYVDMPDTKPTKRMLQDLASSWAETELDASSSAAEPSAGPSLASALLENLRLDHLYQFGYTPLHWAAKRGDKGLITALVQTGTELDVPDSQGDSPLSDAVWSDHIECAKLLLEAGADVNFANHRGQKPITYAFHSPEIMALLLSFGARVSLPSNSPSWSTPLGWTASFDHDLELGRTGGWAQSLDLLISAGLDINRPEDARQQTLLMTALMIRNAPLVDLLLSRGARATDVDSELNTIFHYAARRTQVDCLQLLRRANISTVDPDALDTSGQTAADIVDQRLGPHNGPDTGQRRITSDEAQAFDQLIQEARVRFTSTST